MGKTILTPKQSDVLELAAQEPEIIRWYYFTGGTALSEFYLKHRSYLANRFLGVGEEIQINLLCGFL